MWNNIPTETMPSIWQNMQWMWKGKPLQSNMQKHTKTERQGQKSPQRNNAVDKVQQEEEAYTQEHRIEL